MFDFPWVPIFIMFTPLWWVLVVAAWCLFWWAMEYDSGRGGIGVLMLTLFTMTAFGGTDMWVWIKDHPFNFFLWGSHWYLPGVVPGYILLGAIWGVFRWIIYLRDEKEIYDNVKEGWLEGKGLPDAKVVPKEYQSEWVEFCAKNYPRWVATVVEHDWTAEGGRKNVEKHVLQVKPRARKNKAKITTWMAFWPFSSTWWVLRDFFWKVWDILYRLVGRQLDRISDYIYKDVDDDFVAAQTLVSPKKGRKQ